MEIRSAYEVPTFREHQCPAHALMIQVPLKHAVAQRILPIEDAATVLGFVARRRAGGVPEFIFPRPAGGALFEV
jgi:hypothetical protein